MYESYLSEKEKSLLLQLINNGVSKGAEVLNDSTEKRWSLKNGILIEKCKMKGSRQQLSVH